MGEKEIIIDGVKLVGWPVEMAKNHEKLKGKYKELFRKVIYLEKRVAILEAGVSEKIRV